MYLVGAPHPHRIDAHRLVDRCIDAGERLVTDAEVFQEILHRYTAIDRRVAIQPAFDTLLRIVDEVYPIDLADIQRARELVFTTAGPSARDAVHAATMERYRVEEILSFDSGFDRIPGIRRITG